MDGVTWPEATFILLNIILSNAQSNLGYVSDPELDQLLLDSLTSADPEVGRQLLWDAQKRIIQNAYFVPLYVPSALFGVNNRVHNYVSMESKHWLIDTYIE